MDNPGKPVRILILDYSVDRSEASLFSQWFPSGCRWDSAFIFSGDRIPDPAGYTHVMHTGSSLSICSEAAFLGEAEDAVRYCISHGIPQMGVCYGHQLLCRALMGPSAVNMCPGGLEVGWIDVSMVGSGLQIPGVDPIIRVLQSHFDRAVALPAGSEVIATNDHTEFQGFKHEQNLLLGLQFHPEFSREQGNEFFIEERKLFEENGADIDDIVSCGPSIAAGSVFFEYFISEF